MNTNYSFINDAKDFAKVLMRYDPVDHITQEDIELIFSYVKKHGYKLIEDDNHGFACIEIEDSENGVLDLDFFELIDRVWEWAYELLLDPSTPEEHRKAVLRDMIILDRMVDTRAGKPLGTPTVAELIDILHKVPQDYRVTCCGGDNYLYLFPNEKYITIDNEYYLG